MNEDVPQEINENVPPEWRERLNEKYNCYVVITCEPPKEDGSMNVEMSYEGDISLVSYLLEGAQDLIEDVETSQICEVGSEELSP